MGVAVSPRPLHTVEPAQLAASRTENKKVGNYIMWLGPLLLYLGTCAVAAVVGTRARAQFLELLRDRHPEIYDQLGRPPIGVSTSFLRGVRTQRLVFSNKAGLCGETEAARQHLRRVAVAVVITLLVEVALMMWAFSLNYS